MATIGNRLRGNQIRSHQPFEQATLGNGITKHHCRSRPDQQAEQDLRQCNQGVAKQAAIDQCLPETDGHLHRRRQDKSRQAGSTGDEPPEQERRSQRERHRNVQGVA